jgi:hypothetical protein
MSIELPFGSSITLSRQSFNDGDLSELDDQYRAVQLIDCSFSPYGLVGLPSNLESLQQINRRSTNQPIDLSPIFNYHRLTELVILGMTISSSLLQRLSELPLIRLALDIEYFMSGDIWPIIIHPSIQELTLYTKSIFDDVVLTELLDSAHHAHGRAGPTQLTRLILWDDHPGGIDPLNVTKLRWFDLNWQARYLEAFKPEYHGYAGDQTHDHHNIRDYNINLTNCYGSGDD